MQPQYYQHQQPPPSVSYPQQEHFPTTTSAPVASAPTNHTQQATAQPNPPVQLINTTFTNQPTSQASQMQPTQQPVYQQSTDPRQQPSPHQQPLQQPQYAVAPPVTPHYQQQLPGASAVPYSYHHSQPSNYTSTPHTPYQPHTPQPHNTYHFNPHQYQPHPSTPQYGHPAPYYPGYPPMTSPYTMYKPPAPTKTKRKKEKNKNLLKLASKVKKLTKAITELQSGTDDAATTTQSNFMNEKSQAQYKPAAHEIERNVIRTVGEQNKAKHAFDNSIREMQRLFIETKAYSNDYRFDTFELISQCTFLLRGNLQDIIHVDEDGNVIEVEKPKLVQKKIRKVVKKMKTEIVSKPKPIDDDTFSEEEVFATQHEEENSEDEEIESDELIVHQPINVQQKLKEVNDTLNKATNKAFQHHGPILQKLGKCIEQLNMSVDDMFKFFCSGTNVISDQTLLDAMTKKKIKVSIEDCQKIVKSYDRNGTESLFIIEFQDLLVSLLGEDRVHKINTKFSKNKNQYVDKLSESEKDLCQLIVKTIKANTKPITKIYRELVAHSKNDFLYCDALLKALDKDFQLQLDPVDLHQLCDKFDQDANGLSRSGLLKMIATAGAL